MQSSYAFSATVFFTVSVMAMIVYGGETARYLATIAAFVGAASQFIAQDPRGSARLVSISMAYVAMAIGVAALVMWQ